MIKVVANNYIKADCVEQFLEYAKEIVEKTNANDKGCVKYELCRDANDPLHFVMLEEWESQEAIENHLKAPHFLELIPKMDALNSKPGELFSFTKVF